MEKATSKPGVFLGGLQLVREVANEPECSTLFEGGPGERSVTMQLPTRKLEKCNGRQARSEQQYAVEAAMFQSLVDCAVQHQQQNE